MEDNETIVKITSIRERRKGATGRPTPFPTACDGGGHCEPSCVCEFGNVGETNEGADDGDDGDNGEDGVETVGLWDDPEVVVGSEGKKEEEL